MREQTTPRRGFLGRITSALLGAAATPALARALPVVAVPEVDESWLQGLTGKHKQFFEVPSIGNGRPLFRVSNFLDVYGPEAYGLTDRDVNAVVGLHGPALTLSLDDAMWAKYELGKRNQVNDPLTKTVATRNPFVKREPAYDWLADYSITRLQQRGVRFIGCMRSMRALSMELAASRDAAPAVMAELKSHMLPGVTPVPAMMVAINRAQESGLAYVFMG